MPSGSSAISPTMCFAAGDWHLRFVNKGSGQVRVTVQVRSLLGLLSVLDGGTVRPGDTWTRIAQGRPTALERRRAVDDEGDLDPPDCE